MSKHKKHMHIKNGNFTKPKVTPYEPQYQTYTVTDNIELSDGSIVNRLDDNADFGRDCVDMNHK